MENALVSAFSESGVMALVTYILLKYILSASDRRDKNYQELLEAQTTQANLREERLFKQIEQAQSVYEEQVKANLQQTELIKLIKDELSDNSKVLNKIVKLVEKQ